MIRLQILSRDILFHRNYPCLRCHWQLVRHEIKIFFFSKAGCSSADQYFSAIECDRLFPMHKPSPHVQLLQTAWPLPTVVYFPTIALPQVPHFSLLSCCKIPMLQIHPFSLPQGRVTKPESHNFSIERVGGSGDISKRIDIGKYVPQSPSSKSAIHHQAWWSLPLLAVDKCSTWSCGRCS